MTMLISMKHSWPTDLARLFNSPGLYFRKNVAGSDKRRIIRAFALPLESTGPVSALVILGIISPTIANQLLCDKLSNVVQTTAVMSAAFSVPKHTSERK